jgi:hypothetical protein
MRLPKRVVSNGTAKDIEWRATAQCERIIFLFSHFIIINYIYTGHRDGTLLHISYVHIQTRKKGAENGEKIDKKTCLSCDCS